MALDDGLTQQSIHKLSSHGAGGARASNELRDYRRSYFKATGRTLEPQSLLLTLKDADDVPRQVLTDVLAPYETLHWLHKAAGIEHFARCLLSESLPLETYWRHILQQSWAAKHPLNNPVAMHSLAYTIPLVFY